YHDQGDIEFDGPAMDRLADSQRPFPNMGKPLHERTPGDLSWLPKDVAARMIDDAKENVIEVQRAEGKEALRSAGIKATPRLDFLRKNPLDVKHLKGRLSLGEIAELVKRGVAKKGVKVDKP